MENFRVSVNFLVVSLVFLMFPASSLAQLAPSEARILFQVQKLLEYPAVLQGWNNWTNFCYLPDSTSLRIVCSNNHVTELTIIGNKTASSAKTTVTSSGHFSVSQQTLSGSFSIDSFFTVLSKLTNVKKLSLVSLGLWGPLPAKIKRFGSLEVLNVSSNFIYGQIPQEIASTKTLTSLVLADNLLNGSVPDLKSLPFLQELNLGGNNLGPEFPSLGNNLTTIILSNNSLRSEIPASFKNLKLLQKLDISSNKLIGPIPPALFSLPSLKFLDLAQNQLSGALSANVSCSANLQFVNISHNLLIGKLPSCIAFNSSNRTVVSSWNCLASGNANYQHPFSFCHKEALAVKPTTKSEKDSSIKLGVIIGIIGGVVGIAAILALLILIIARRSKTKRTEHRKFEGSVSDKMSFRSYAVPAIDSKRVPQTMRSAAIGLPLYRILTLEEIEDATSNFDQENLIAEVPQGVFYKGWLRDGLLVLIRSVKLKQKHLPPSLKQQMEVLSKLRHVHLVSVLGHCTVTYQDRPSTTTAIYVVFENISNGSLRDYLTDRRKRETLKWPQRMAITIGIARGIQFLHSGVSPGLFGNNVRIENVLLDETLTAKLSNYCIPLPSKMGSESPLSRQEIHDDRNSIENPEKEDVYQFGVILVQAITGKLVTSTRELDELKLQLEKGLSEPPSKLRGLVDPSTLGSFAYESMRNTVEIALNCLARDHRSRPSIEDVLWNLQYSIQVQEGWTSSGNLGLQI